MKFEIVHGVTRLSEETLRRREGRAWVVAAMHLGVAVHATPPLGDSRSTPPTWTADWTGRYRGLDRAMRGMAGLAQERWPALQQGFRGRAVRVMAVGAVFTYGLVVVHERTALFHVAGVASFHHAVAFHEAGTGGTMYVVAV